jgi:hypothetical protein
VGRSQPGAGLQEVPGIVPRVALAHTAIHALGVFVSMALEVDEDPASRRQVRTKSSRQRGRRTSQAHVILSRTELAVYRRSAKRLSSSQSVKRPMPSSSDARLRLPWTWPNADHTHFDRDSRAAAERLE